MSPFDKLFTVCNWCGAHAIGMQICSRCCCVRYCDEHCQKMSWKRCNHRCSSTNDDDDDISSMDKKSPETSSPFEKALKSCKYKITYFKYCEILTRWSKCLPKPECDESLNCPPTVLSVIAAYKPKVKQQIINTVRKIFFILTALELPDESPPMWKDIRCMTPELQWTRHAADNEEYIIGRTTIELMRSSTTKNNMELHQFKIFDAANDKLIVTITHDYRKSVKGLSGCGTCIFWNRQKCLMHMELCMRDVEIRSIEMIDSLHLDPFSKLALFDVNKDDALECECFTEVKPCDVTRFFEEIGLEIAVVRLRTTRGIIDFIAYHMHPADDKQDPITTLIVDSKFLNVIAEI